jgi:hypothetical protein
MTFPESEALLRAVREAYDHLILATSTRRRVIAEHATHAKARPCGFDYNTVLRECEHCRRLARTLSEERRR